MAQCAQLENECCLPAEIIDKVGPYNHRVGQCADNNTGSLGLMLGRKLKKSPQGAFAKVISMVAGIYIGGPVGIDKILTLHGPPAMEDSLELLEVACSLPSKNASHLNMPAIASLTHSYTSAAIRSL